MCGTVLASAAINYTIVHSPVVFIMIVALLVHEFGHFTVAKIKGADPDLPFLIPLFPLIIGLTRIKNVDDKDIRPILFAGPAFGALFILLMILFNTLYGIVPFIPLFFMLAFEIIMNYFGSDGRKFRRAKIQTI
jgi:hypothetical protein